LSRPVVRRMRRLPVAAKINLALVVGERQANGLHEIATVLQRIDLEDRVTLERAPGLSVLGFREDTIVRCALVELAGAAGVEPAWHIQIDKRIPVAAGLGGGSADAAAALRLANESLEKPLDPEALHEVAARVGADVPFFLEPGPKLAEGGGERLTRLEIPQDYWVLVAVPARAAKLSTGDVYRRFDVLGGGPDFEERRAALLGAIEACRRPRDFAAFPPNDLAEAAGGRALADELVGLGAFRADVSGAGPAVYALFHHRPQAAAAARATASLARSWITVPVW
jgi:4-diphosphocytidyl-2-C-methyl-D-erythritol kinase